MSEAQRQVARIRRARLKAGEAAWSFALTLAFPDDVPATPQALLNAWDETRKRALDIVKANLDAVPRHVQDQLVGRNRERMARGSDGKE